MKNKFIAYFTSLILVLCFSGCSDRPVDRPMGEWNGWNHMMGYGGYGGFFMWITFAIITVVIIYFIMMQSKTTRNSTSSIGESPTDILKKRYAKGEITKEEFDRLKRDIES